MPSPDPPHPKTNPSSDADDRTAAPGKPTHSESDLNTSPPEAEGASEVTMEVKVGMTLGGYRLVKKLGEGGMGFVFEAEEARLNRRVAMKVMKPDVAAKDSNRQRFLREAKAAAAVEHDHIVPILTIGEESNVPFIVMPFLKGEPLDARLKKGQLETNEIMTIIRQAAEGLAAAHEHGLIHRDIKPANIWLEETKTTGVRVKILDFGLARISGDEINLTQSGAIMGTPAYMAPEQARGLEVDHRADLFSLGCILYEMTTGKRAFTGRDTMAILSSLALDIPVEPIKLNPQLPPALSQITMKLLEKDPAKRTASAKEVADALKKLQPESTVVVIAQSKPVAEASPWADIDASGMTDMVTPPPQVEPSRAKPVKRDAASSRSGSKKPLLIGGGLAAVALIVAAIVIFGKKNDKVEPAAKREQVAKGDPKSDKKGDLPGKAEPLPAKFKNALGMEFVLVPKGKSWLGGSAGNVGTAEVVISQDFYLGVYEVTQEEWEKVTGSNPSGFKSVPGLSKEDQKRFPVEQMSWDDCQLFIKRLNEQMRDAGWKYRLPTEVEWEYGCRGGPMKDKSESGFDFYLEKPSNTLLPSQANFNNSVKRPCKVGSYPPNRLGLHDMHGNVWEWCTDEIPADPKDPKGASQRVYRGGSWLDGSWICRAAFRNMNPPSFRFHNHGLRVARVPVDPNPKKEPIAKIEPKKFDPPPFVPPTFDEKEAKKQQDEWSAKLKLPVESTNKLGMKMMLIPPAGEALPKAYYLGKYEVTQGEWEKVMGYNPSGFGPQNAKVKGMDTSKLPVEQVSWFDSVEFCNKLSEQEDLKPYYDLTVTRRGGKDGKQIEDAEVKILGGSGYHIPTDVEWTWGCAAGAKTRYHFGDEDEDLPEYAWFDKNSEGMSHAVGEKKPNAFGLYDMHGNVREWNEEKLSNATTGAPERVHRGGGWNYLAGFCAVSYRIRIGPAYRNNNIHGLRLAQVP